MRRVTILTKPVISTVDRSVRSHGRYHEMPQPPGGVSSMLPAQKLVGESLLHPPVNIVQEHVSNSRLLPVPSHNRRRVNRRHSSRSFGEVTFRSVDHDQIPLRVVELVGEPRERELAALVPSEVRFRGETARLSFVRAEKLVGFL